MHPNISATLVRYMRGQPSRKTNLQCWILCRLQFWDNANAQPWLKVWVGRAITVQHRVEDEWELSFDVHTLNCESLTIMQMYNGSKVHISEVGRQNTSARTSMQLWGGLEGTIHNCKFVTRIPVQLKAAALMLKGSTGGEEKNCKVNVNVNANVQPKGATGEIVGVVALVAES